MDRRVLAVVVVVAVAAAVLLGSWMAPGADPIARPQGAAASVAPTQPASTAAAAPRLAKRRPPAVGAEVPQQPRAVPPVTGGSGPPPSPAPVRERTEPTPEYRCRALGQQSDLIDQLIVIGSGAAVDEAQRATMASRVAQKSMRVFEEGESLWSGDLDCAGISDINLGSAANFLASALDELELDETVSTEVEQALAVLDTVDWHEDE